MEAQQGNPQGNNRTHLSRTASWALLILFGTLLTLSTWFAATQPPRPDPFRPIGNWDVAKADWWRYPLERNAFRRTVIAADLNAVFVLPDSKQVWAVGGGGLIVHSDDDGRTWRQQRPRVAAGTQGAPAAAASLLPIASAQAADAGAPAPELKQQQQQQQIDAKQGNYDSGSKADTAAGDKPAATPSPNKAEPPSPGAPPEPPPEPAIDRARTDLQAVFFVDAQRGWAVGDGGTVIATRDGGARWQPQASGTQAWLQSLHFAADGQRGWAVGVDGTVIATRDGGASWQPQASGTQRPLTSIGFAADGQRGWAVG
ncbi:MAG: hypothetical protein IT469_03470, partial [Pseudomonadales bacterium]|nr:hypothetical protein [Pseudomonadales bacterium]